MEQQACIIHMKKLFDLQASLAMIFENASALDD